MGQQATRPMKGGCLSLTTVNPRTHGRLPSSRLNGSAGSTVVFPKAPASRIQTAGGRPTGLLAAVCGFRIAECQGIRTKPAVRGVWRDSTPAGLLWLGQ